MLLRSISVILAMLFGASVAAAQNADAPVMGSSASDTQADVPARAQTPERQHILVTGDAIGGGLGAGLMRMAEIDGHYDVTIRFNEESGLARPEVYDWSETLPKILEGKDYDVVVVLLGSNDRQQIRSGNMRLAFGTQEWIAAYKARLDSVLDVLTVSGAKVYWIGLPPMASADYDSAMQAVAALQKERAEARGAIFLDIRSAFLNPDGSYTDTGPDETGAVRKLRARDGITFFKQGNNRMGQIVLAAIAKGAPSEAPPQAAATASGKTSIPEVVVPFFGQADASGLAVVIQPQDVTGVAVLALGADTALPPSAALSALQQLARPGSEAEKLFATGTAGAAPAGRVDDFTAPSPAAP